MDTTTTAKKRRPKRQRKSKLQALAIRFGIADAIKLNTLEKSKLDWNRFVEKEGIGDDLKKFNKDGYMEKVAFLQRTDERQADQLMQQLKRTGSRR
ncbi:Craniofacial development protein 1 [Quaeritorhiza haematococci]|nr:Craniofacial development protein 1 [Quaeritorhiza haematococci]